MWCCDLLIAPVTQLDSHYESEAEDESLDMASKLSDAMFEKGFERPERRQTCDERSASPDSAVMRPMPPSTIAASANEFTGLPSPDHLDPA